MYEFGKVVLNLSEVNVNLKCGARTSSSPPYLVASVVPVPDPHLSTGCKEGSCSSEYD